MAKGDSGQGAVLLARHGRLVVATHQSWSYTALWTSTFDEIFTYGIKATRQTHFSHLGMTAGNDGG
jgi:hypothetical protein